MEGDKADSESLPPNPESSANIFSRLTLGWTLGVFRKGSAKDLEVSDLYTPLESHKSDKLGNKLDSCWDKELENAKLKNRSPSLLRAILKGFGAKILLYGFFMFAGEVLFRIAQPLLLAQLLVYFAPGSSMSRQAAFGYATGVVFCTGASVVINNPAWLGSLLHAMKIRIACCSVIYRKSLRLSQAAVGQSSLGQAVNLMTNDVNRFDTGIVYMHFLWIGPLTTIVVSYFLWREIGVSAFVGVAALIISVPAQILLGKQKSVYRLRTAKRTDERIRLMNEIINGILVIKMYTWEKPFAKLVSEARRLEVKEIRGSSYITGILFSFLLFNNHMAIFGAIVTYVFMGNFITASIAYVVTAYFTLIRNMMTQFFPFAVGSTAELLVSIKRVEKFLLYEEMTQQTKPALDEKGNLNLAFECNINGDLKKNNSLDIMQCSINNTSPLDVVLRNASAKWNKDSEETLQNINVNFPSGKLSVIIGPVGSGKSSLLHTLLKELPLSRGTLHIAGSVSYAAQQPWLFKGSVRQNILFGSEYDDSKYRRVVRACALSADLQQLAHGDRTLVGDRGATLSGGQRARINMARAIYKDCDVYLLDDPLSAVDTHVGKHLYEQCISGFLKGKTVILVTHQLQYLGNADHIVLMQEGKVQAQGTYQELKSSGADFSKLMFENKDLEEVDNIHAGYHPMKGSEEESGGKLQVEGETRSHGSISGRVFISYLTAGGHWCSAAGLLFMFCLTQFFVSAQDWWLNYWVNLEEYVYHSNRTSPSAQAGPFPFYVSQTWCIAIFSVLIATTIVVSLSRSFYFVYMCMRSSIWLHHSMFSAITRSVMRFFHTNPSGRILNRFSKDMGAVDELLPISLLNVLQIGLSVVGIVGVLALVNAWLLVPTFVVGYAFSLLRGYYLKTSRNIKRLEGITRSPVFSHLNASLQGLSTIRAFKAEPILEKEFDNHQDLHTATFHMFAATSQAFGYWLDVICFLYITVVTFSFLLIGDSWLGGSVGLAITQTIGIVGIFQFGMRQSADLENFMTSVERILEYTRITQEPPLESQPEMRPPSDWPSEGRVEFRKVSMAYDSSLPSVLKGLSFTVNPREKVGVVGRTGAGKSSLTNAIFRLAPVEGMIIIDNIDVTNIGLHDLRAKLSIIPQEPVLFSGTVRKNLDPFDNYPDHVLWSALEEVELKGVIAELPEGLNGRVTEGGSNLSVGQRQLMCLARAIVRNNRVLVMDEATANVDPQTDALIQSTIRRKFADCTVLTVAHRLNTVMDSDKILVMNEGNLVEFDHPHILLSNKQGYLHKMVEDLGRSAADSLHTVAAENYKNKTS